MKKIIWIDDDLSKMSYVAKNLFPVLWKENISSQIIFLGDNYREDSKITINDSSINKLTNDISDFFEMYCAEVADRDKKRPKEIRDSSKDLRPARPSIIVQTDHNEIMKEIENELKKNNGQELYIGVDIRLFIHDKRLLEETIAMKIFYKWTKDKACLGNNNYTVFLYSTFTKEDDVRIHWEKKIKEYHNDLHMNIRIYGRDELIFCDEKSRDYKDFLKLLSIKSK
jgi:hypothetical protein